MSSKNSRIRAILDLMPMRLTCNGDDSAFVEVSSVLLVPAGPKMTNAQVAREATRALDEAAADFATERKRAE